MKEKILCLPQQTKAGVNLKAVRQTLPLACIFYEQRNVYRPDDHV